MSSTEKPVESSSGGKLPDIPALTGLRLFAALFVVMAHATHFGPPDHLTGISAFIYNYASSASALGMSLFFVLSGFVIHYNYRSSILNDGPVGYWNFFVARFSRLYPLFIVMILFDAWRTGFLGQLIGGQPDAAERFQTAAPYYLTLTQAWFYDIVSTNNLVYQFGFVSSIAWSISTEFFFYMCYPLVCIATLVAPRIWMKVVLGVLVSVFALTALINVINHAPQIQEYGARYFGAPAGAEINSGQDSLFRWMVYFSPYSRVFEFILGVVTCDIYLRVARTPPGRRESAAAPFLTLAAVLAIVTVHGLMFDPERRFPIMTQLHMSFGYAVPVALFLFCVARYRTVASRLLGAKPVVVGGEISYSTYLIHIMVLDAAARVGVFNLVSDPVLLVFLKIGFAFVVTLALAYVSYRIIEVPTRTWLRRSLAVPIKPRSQAPWMMPLVGATRAGVIALLVVIPLSMVLVNHPPVSNPPPEGTIEVVEATYGGNCSAPRGNTTADVVGACAGRKSCTYIVDVKHLGDPAGGCGKDFSLTYRCGRTRQLMGAHIPSEAGLGGYGVAMSCAPS